MVSFVVYHTNVSSRMFHNKKTVLTVAFIFADLFSPLLFMGNHPVPSNSHFGEMLIGLTNSGDRFCTGWDMQVNRTHLMYKPFLFVNVISWSVIFIP
jgi:hypothetical protein